MTLLNEIYKCNICGNIVEVLQAGNGTLVCCGEDMRLLKANTVDASKEKHVPVWSNTVGISVKVGSIPHPMEENHYIELIEVIADGRVYRKYLKPGDKPEAAFDIKASNAEVRAYCNIHGLWKA